ncbi:MAG: YdcF family protein [Neisseriales bacterium]|nr:MAG: YdcF family protein [Neisseriales bacterium]
MRYFLYGLLLSGLLLCFVTLYVAWSIYRYGYRIDQTDYRADAALVLGAAVWGNKPSPIFQERINHAIWLYRTQHVRMLIFTGGTPQHLYPTEAEVGRRYAIKQGIPPRDILIENRSRTTYDNLNNAAKEARAVGLRSFLIVSDHYHMCRAMQIARDLDIEALPSATKTTRYQTRGLRVRFLIQETYHYMAYRLLSIIRKFFRVVWS